VAARGRRAAAACEEDVRPVAHAREEDHDARDRRRGLHVLGGAAPAPDAARRAARLVLLILGGLLRPIGGGRRGRDRGRLLRLLRLPLGLLRRRRRLGPLRLVTLFLFIA